MMKKWSYSGSLDQKISKLELKHRQLAEELAVKGIVLLKNENLLPISGSKSVALFGNGAEYTVKGGIGSGDVNNRENISIYRGLKESKVRITSEKWLSEYRTRYENARKKWKEHVLEAVKYVENPFDAYAENPFVMPEGRLITENDIKSAEVAIYVISRISGEGKDRRLEEGDYYLSQQERENIMYLNAKRIPIVLVLNAGGPIEITDILQQAEYVGAVLNISQLGQEGGYAVADILLGTAIPEGKLTTTWARRYDDYPLAETFGYLDGNLATQEYREGIYVGYRYFDRFHEDPLFSFGYGLSYTTFKTEFELLHVMQKGIKVEVCVENTGNQYSGREVVQVYITPPRTGVDKEYKRLAGFAKTKQLLPGAKEKIHIIVDQKQFAVFSEQIQAWVIEAGEYGIWIGNHAGSLKLAAVVEVLEQSVVERTRPLKYKKGEWSELEAETISLKGRGNKETIASKEQVMKYVLCPCEEKCVVEEGGLDIDIPVEELIPLLYGNITQSASTLGSSGIRVPGSAGETTECLEAGYAIPSLIMADGPAGLRLRQSYEVSRETGEVYGAGVLSSLENGYLESMEHHQDADVYYQYCTAFPVGTALAQTWDTDLLRRFGEAIAEEMATFHVNLWLAPGMNIHRNPLCGRNYEYYSEDPLLSGKTAAAITLGVQSRKGCGVTLKHFACNNQEDNRMSVDCRVSERALREIYLRGFEIAIKEADPVAVMSSYNLVNGVHAANNVDLCNTVLREEWGFKGMVMSDWNTTVPEDGSIPWKCVQAGNDMIMPGNPQDDQIIREAYKDGKISKEDIYNCAKRILYVIQRLRGKFFLERSESGKTWQAIGDE